LVENKISVVGHVKYPGEYAYEMYKSVYSVIKKVEFLPDTDITYGEVYRINRLTNSEELITFVPLDVIQGKKDIQLKPLDRVSFYKMRYYEPISISGEIESPMIISYYDGISLLDVLRGIKFKTKVEELKLDIFTADKGHRTVYLQDLLVRGVKNLDTKHFTWYTDYCQKK